MRKAALLLGLMAVVLTLGGPRLAGAQQPTQQAAAASRIELEVQIAELRERLQGSEERSANPVAFAMDELTLAEKLAQLGEWEPGPHRLSEAAEAYRDALKTMPCAQFATICSGAVTRLHAVEAMIAQRQ